MNIPRVEVCFGDIKSHRQLISLFGQVYGLTAGEILEVTLDFSKDTQSVHSDHLLVVLVILDWLRERGVRVDIIVCGHSEDADQVGFFKLAGIAAAGHNSGVRKGRRRVGLSRFTNDTTYILQDQLTIIMHQIRNVSIEVKQLVFYCLGEIMDNVLVHSGKGHGWVSAQYYPSQKEIRLMICDSGIGIHQALRSGDGPAFDLLTEHEALALCIRQGTTNGKGMGFGLFATSRFVALNQGEMLLYSGHHFLEIDQHGDHVYTGPYWQGTMVALKIRMDVPVDYQSIMPLHHSLPDDYQFFIDRFFGEENELW